MTYSIIQKSQLEGVLRWFKKYWGLFLIILLSWWTIKPLFHSGFFPMHDDTQVVRVSQMAKALREGQFPVRWVSDLGYGYGYPLFNFYAPFPYYVGALFQLLGLDSLIATKLMFGIGIVLAGVFMYFLAREFWGELGAVLSAILYQYAPYHAVDIYVRGAVGEFYALAFLPLVIYGLYKLYRVSQPKYVIIGSLGYVGVILSHNITAMLLTGVIFIASLLHCFIVVLKKQKLQFIIYHLSLIILGLGLSAFFWLPALAEVKYANVEQMIREESNFREHFLYLDQLWDSPWGFAGSAPGRAEGMSFKIGKLHIIFAMVGVFFLVYSWRKGKLSRMATWLHGYMATWLILSVFMTTEHSKFIWEAIPLLSYAQYPWRFLIFIIFSTSFLGGSLALIVRLLPKDDDRRILAIMKPLIFTGLVIFINAKYFQPQKFLSVRATDYLSEENIKWRTSRISNEYLPKDFPKPQTQEKIVKEKITAESGVRILNQKIKTHRYEFLVDSNEPHNIFIRTAHFPGWQVFIDNQKSDVRIVNGQMLISLPSGEHDVVVKFNNTPVRSFANFISLLSLFFLILNMRPSKKVF